ncbi:hypothetical protein Rhal01_00246 [Rubritalea halochordaticola]|uniref:Uncharacterized protein n=1 Tax=Rubritalea halochordaticola TaxID=714537 RepID=A0ABP9UWL1_9BACT
MPGNARFYVDEDRKLIVPAPPLGQALFYPVPGHGKSTENFDRIASESELRDSNYELPATREWDSYRLYGPEVSILRALVSGYPERWTDEGWWQY